MAPNDAKQSQAIPAIPLLLSSPTHSHRRRHRHHHVVIIRNIGAAAAADGADGADGGAAI